MGEKEIQYTDLSATYAAAVAASEKIEAGILACPQKFRALTGDRPTGRLHIGHYFGSIQNRVRLQNLGVPLMALVADFQVLTDHDAFGEINENAMQLVIDYLACGIKPGERVTIFAHSLVPELNELILPFLTLVTVPELERNPTVKDEMAKSLESGSVKSVNAGMLTYPAHQACDILFCKANVVPVGKDQLPHLETTRAIARRFNAKYAKKNPVFPEPRALLSKSPMIKGLDGSKKMSKSLGNAVALSASEDETAALVKKARTDSERAITYEPERRPEVANLLQIVSLCSGEDPAAVAARIGGRGSAALKEELAFALNEKLRPIREERARLEKDRAYIRSVLLDGSAAAREIASATLNEVRAAMNMAY